jgi:hypothetical protein
VLGLLVFFGGVAFLFHGDREGVVLLVHIVIALGGLSVIVGAATCDIVDAIAGGGANQPKAQGEGGSP